MCATWLRAPSFAFLWRRVGDLKPHSARLYRAHRMLVRSWKTANIVGAQSIRGVPLRSASPVIPNTTIIPNAIAK